MQRRTQVFWFVIGFVSALVVLLMLVLASLLFQTKPPTLAQIKNFGESIKPNIEILAIAIAGWWSYRLFVKTLV